MPAIRNILLLFFLFVYFATQEAYATCTVSSPSYYLTPNSDQDLTATFTNTGNTDINWIKIPKNYYSVIFLNSLSLQESDWTLQETGDSYIYNSNTLGPSSTLHFNINIHTSDDRAIGLTWFGASDSNGDTFESCSDLSIEVNGSPPQAPTISNTALSISNTQATLTWNTNAESTGSINYGTSSSYGSTTTTASNTIHSATLSSLTPSTTYHYQITATNQAGNTTTTDATFTTAAADVTVTTTTTVTNTIINTIQNTITKILSDTTPPSTVIINDFSKTLKEVGTVEGVATDKGLVNAGISSLDYSLDNGKNWLPITDISSPGAKKTDFSFAPNIIDDGNYTIKIRAKDLSGNTKVSKPYTIIIDRLPPTVGETLFLSGPLILHPNNQGNIQTIAGLPVDITLSAVGGPLSIDLFAGTNTFALKKNAENGLWHGTILLSNEGNYPAKIKSIDGGNNETEKNLLPIIVLSPGKITSQQKNIQGAIVSVYTLEKTTNNYTLWESEPFGQTNPQKTDDNGNYRFVLPPGSYYLQVESSGKTKLRTNIFELTNVTPINQNFNLENSSFWTIWKAKITNFTPQIFTPSSNTNSTLTGKPMPDFDLSTKNKIFSNLSILGKPTIVTFFSSWNPLSSDQIKELNLLKKENEGLNVYAVALQESVSKTNIFQKTGNYDIDIIADPDGIFTLPLSLQLLPAHIFIDKKGIIKSVQDNYLTKSSLLQEILK